MAYPLRPVSALPPNLFVENGKYDVQVTLDGLPLPADAEVLFNDRPVEPIIRRGVQLFPVELGFYAGTLRISIVQGRRCLASDEVEVDPDRAKLTRNEYAALIADVARATLALYRLAGLTVPAEVNPTAVRADIVTLDLIRSNFDAFERAVARIADQPVRRLESVPRHVEILRSRRVGDRAVAKALRLGSARAATAAEVHAAPRLTGALGGRWIPSVEEPTRRERLDVYENRALLGFLRWLSGVIEAIARRLAAEQPEMPPALAVAWLGRVSDWRSRIAALSRRDLFAGLPPDPSLRATSVFRMHPDYAAAFSAMVRMKAGLGTGSGVSPTIPLDRTFSLYEIWCYIGLLQAVGEAFPACRPRIAALLKGASAPNRVGTMLANGEMSALPLGDGLSLTYQRRFSPKPDPTGCRTLVIEAVPDVTIARVGPDGRCSRLVIFDPKYRGGAFLMEGLRDLHVYRDAILGVDGNRLISTAVAIAPRPFAVPVDLWLNPGAPGSVAARPGHDPNVFRTLIDGAIRSLT